jgi:hypothetical protein
MRQVATGCFQWWALYLIAFLLTFPLWARPLLNTIGAVLGALNNFGSA